MHAMLYSNVSNFLKSPYSIVQVAIITEFQPCNSGLVAEEQVIWDLKACGTVGMSQLHTMEQNFYGENDFQQDCYVL